MSRGRRVCAYIKKHVFGDEDTLPDHARLSWILALITINMDMSVPVLYTAIMTTDYGCDVFTLYGVFYGLENANFLMPIVCGWLVDFLGTWSHVVLIVSCVLCSIMQAATLITSSVWLLGAIFLARQWLINQAVVQSFKLMAIRTHKLYGDDEEKKEQECQRTGIMSDLWSAFGELVFYAVVYFIPDGIGRYVLVFGAVGTTVVAAFLTLSYSRSDLIKDAEKYEAEKARRRSSMARAVSNEGSGLLEPRISCCQRLRWWFSCKKDSPMHRACQYLLGIRQFFCVFMVAIPFFHYILVETFRAMITYPLNQNEAAGLESIMPGVCDGLLKNIYLQGFFGNVFFVLGALLYLRFVAMINPANYFLFVYPLFAFIFGGLATIFYLPNVPAVAGAIVLAVMNTASYYATEFDTWYLMSVIDDDLYGYYTLVSGVLLSLFSVGSAAFMTFQIDNNLLLLTCQGMAALTVVMSVLFGIAARKRLKEAGAHGHGGGGGEKDRASFAKLADADDDAEAGGDGARPASPTVTG